MFGKKYTVAKKPRGDGYRTDCQDCVNARARNRYQISEDVKEKAKTRVKERIAKRHTDARIMDLHRENKKRQRARYKAQGLTRDGKPRQRSYVDHTKAIIARHYSLGARRYALSMRAWIRADKGEHGKAWHGINGEPWKWRGLTQGQQWKMQYDLDPTFRLNETIRNQVKKKRQAIPHMDSLFNAAVRWYGRNNRAGGKLREILGYGPKELRAHLERQFKRGMSWDNYGVNGWHVDHILPKRCFDLSTLDGIRACWALPNLRPLPAKENIAKMQKVLYLL